jgi:type II secretory pathway pseudopilin PulG
MSRIFKKPQGSRGYTLAEMIVYVGLVALLLLVIAGTSMTMATAHRRSRAYLDLNSAAISAFSRFSRDIRRATSVDTLNSTLGASSGKLVLNMKKSDGTNDTTTFYLSDTKVKIDVNGTYSGDITQDNLAVSNLTFRKFSIATTTAIRVEMTLAPDASTTVPAINFYGTYVMRGSYVE